MQYIESLISQYNSLITWLSLECPGEISMTMVTWEPHGRVLMGDFKSGGEESAGEWEIRVELQLYGAQQVTPFLWSSTGSSGMGRLSTS